MLPLKKLFDFAELIHAFEQVERTARRPYGTRFENDAEHSYQLAMVAWYVAEANNLPFSREKLLSYALAHDLVEVYAGDTYFTDEEAQKTKHSREMAALERIRNEFPEGHSIINSIEAYERREDPESKFIYALDKLLPVIQIYLEKGALWHEQKVPFEVLADMKDAKIRSTSVEVLRYWEELYVLLEQNKKALFFIEPKT